MVGQCLCLVIGVVTLSYDKKSVNAKSCRSVPNNSNTWLLTLMLFTWSALLPQWVWAQVFDAYVQPAFDDPALPRAPRSAWLGDPELRMKPEFNNAGSNSASYSVRFRPRPGKQRQLDRQLYDLENAQLKLQWQQHYNQLVTQRYLAMLTLAEAEAELWQKEQRRITNRSRVRTEQALASRVSRSGGAEAVQQAILDLGLAESRVEQMRQRVALLRRETVGAYFEPGPEDIGLSGRLISPKALVPRLVGIEEQATSAAQVLQAARLNSEQAAQRLALARSESRFGLSLLEVGYDDKQQDSYNLTLGFHIPSHKGSRGESRRVRELIQAEQKSHLVNAAYAQSLRSKLSVLRLEIEHFKLEAAALTRHRSQLAQAARGDASVQQILREHELELQSHVISQHAKVLRGYVDLLAFTGQFYPTTINWLRAQQS